MYPGPMCSSRIRIADRGPRFNDPTGQFPCARLLQDHLYLTALGRQLGLGGFGGRVSRDPRTQVFSDTNASAPVGFSQTGNDYENARRFFLARRIAMERNSWAHPENPRTKSVRRHRR